MRIIIDNQKFKRLNISDKVAVLRNYERDAQELIHRSDELGQYNGRLLQRNVERVRERYGIQG